MKPIFKLLFRVGTVLAWIFTLWIGGCAVLGGWPWSHKEKERITSPDGKYDAIVVWHERPPLTLNRESICIVPAGEKLDPKQTVLLTDYLDWAKFGWTGPREFTITNMAIRPIRHYEPIWPKYPRMGNTSDLIRVVLVIDHEIDSLNKLLHGTAGSRADASSSVP